MDGSIRSSQGALEVHHAPAMTIDVVHHRQEPRLGSIGPFYPF